MAIEPFEFFTPELTETNSQQTPDGLPAIQTVDPEELAQMPKFMREAAMAIEEFDRYCKENPDGGFITGFPLLDEAILGFQPGIHFVGGMSNAGKSSFLLSLAWNIAHHNDNAYVLYVTLDDGTNDLLPRIVAMEQQVPINVARYPGRFQEDRESIDRREEGVRILYENTDKFGIINRDYGWEAEELETLVKDYTMELAIHNGERQKLCILIDNFHDLGSEQIPVGTDANARFEVAGGVLKNIAETYDVPIICTAEYKKLEGKSRPLISDVKQTGKTIYQATTVLLCYNEVGIKDEAAKVYFAREDRDTKAPVYEVHVAKNKSSNFKGRIFYEFYEDLASFVEVPRHQAGHYLNMLGG